MTKKEEIGIALGKTREYGIPIWDSLWDVMEKAKKSKNVDESMENLRKVWEDAQPSLAIIQAEHQGALDYFIEIKDRIKERIKRQQW